MVKITTHFITPTENEPTINRLVCHFLWSLWHSPERQGKKSFLVVHQKVSGAQKNASNRNRSISSFPPSLVRTLRSLHVPRDLPHRTPKHPLPGGPHNSNSPPVGNVPSTLARSSPLPRRLPHVPTPPDEKPNEITPLESCLSLSPLPKIFPVRFLSSRFPSLVSTFPRFFKLSPLSQQQQRSTTCNPFHPVLSRRAPALAGSPRPDGVRAGLAAALALRFRCAQHQMRLR